jgi:hypothetical protein
MRDGSAALFTLFVLLAVEGRAPLVESGCHCRTKADLARSASHGVLTNFGAASNRYFFNGSLPWLSRVVMELNDEADDFAKRDFADFLVPALDTETALSLHAGTYLP